MPVWLGVLILAAIVALTVAVVWGVRKFGQFSEQNTRSNRELIAEVQRRTEDAARDINASTALLHASLIDSLGTIARIRKEGGNLPPHPEPAAHTSEEEVA